jgi:hypothetical protein
MTNYVQFKWHWNWLCLFWSMLWGCLICKVKTKGLGLDSCDLDLGWHHFVATSIGIELWN